MGYAIMQIKDASGEYVDWDGRLVALPDGTLGSIVVKKVLEERVTRAKGLDVALPASADTVVASHSVPVGEVHKVFAYALSPDSTGVDSFKVRVDGQDESIIYTRTYAGGDVSDYILVDNSGGAAPVDVELVAHNDSLTGHTASGHILVEDVTESQAPYE